MISCVAGCNMLRVIGRPFLAIVAALLGLAAMSTAAAAADRYDVSYFWSRSLAGVPEIKRLMALPGPDRILTGVASIPGSARVYNKTGSTARVCGDAGIRNVKGPDGKRYPYTVIGIIEKD